MYSIPVMIFFYNVQFMETLGEFLQDKNISANETERKYLWK